MVLISRVVAVVVETVAAVVQPEGEADQMGLKGRKSASRTTLSGLDLVVRMSTTTTASVAMSTSVLPVLRRQEPENPTRLTTAQRRLPTLLQWGLALWLPSLQSLQVSNYSIMGA